MIVGLKGFSWEFDIDIRKYSSFKSRQFQSISAKFSDWGSLRSTNRNRIITLVAGQCEMSYNQTENKQEHGVKRSSTLIVKNGWSTDSSIENSKNNMPMRCRVFMGKHHIYQDKVSLIFILKFTGSLGMQAFALYVAYFLYNLWVNMD